MVRVGLVCLGLLAAVLPLGSAVIFVRGSGSGPETNGSSWATAFTTITQALQFASNGDELWVAAGTYRGALKVSENVALFGGFSGNETSRTDRNWERNRTVIDWDQWCHAYPDEYRLPQPAVFLGAGSRLDGFTVQNGRHSYGAGIYAADAGATVANNIIVTNSITGIPGGALLIDRTGALRMTSDFFVETASDLLQQQFPFGATNIPIAEYGPAVHRLLQVAANVYDAARADADPAVFRPQFTSTSQGVIISGYYQDNSAASVEAWLASNPYGIPMIVAARKGIPNFNEFSSQTAVLAARRLEFRRRDTNSWPYQTNEMYLIGISNVLGLEAWNSFTQAYNGPLEIMIGNQLTISVTNSDGLNYSKQTTFSALSSMNPWPGFGRPDQPSSPVSRQSFRVPLFTNVITLTNSVYRFGPTPHLEPGSATNMFTTNSGFRTPEWHLSISNNLKYILLKSGRILDFVYLPNLTNHLNLSSDLLHTTAMLPGETFITRCWDTNRLANPGGGSSAVLTPTAGIQAQIDISLGNPAISVTQWKQFSFDTVDKAAGIQSFREFVFPMLYPGNSNTNLVQPAPFTPSRKLILSVHWEANDPLIHQLPEHLKDLTNNFSITFVRPSTGEMVTNQTLGRLNGRYNPWFGPPLRSPQPQDADARIKDPLVRISDDFDFPSGPEVNAHWLDRIHRGTPWQTLYFESAVAPMCLWTRHFLDPMSHPTNDWRIIDYLRARIVYDDPSSRTRVLNNTVVGNSGGVLIAQHVKATVMNNTVAYNDAGIFAEDGNHAGFSRNCTYGNVAHNNGDVLQSPQFVSGGFSVLATSPLVDGGDPAALGWMERNALGGGIDIGAFEFGPQGVPAFTSKRSGDNSTCEMELRGFPGQTYLIEASTNLAQWTAVNTNVAEMGRLIFRDAQTTNFPYRYYRARTP